jgi:hypothetical protein
VAMMEKLYKTKISTSQFVSEDGVGCSAPE